MKIPQRPPSKEAILSKQSPKRIGELFAEASEIWIKDRYLHWDELRRRPAPAKLTHEEWWFLLKFGRGGKMRPIPLRGKDDRMFQFTLPDPLLEQLHSIDRGLGTNWNLPDAVTHSSTRNEYVLSTLVQESITSSQLEGAVTTREVAKEMLRTGREPRDKSERMILNNYVTMRRIMDVRAEPLSPELVLELHRRVTEGTLDDSGAAGRFRRTDELIRVMDFEGTVYHEPPPAGELRKRMDAMCAFANQESPDFFVHPVVRAIILHFWLAYDHPFVDGNGRTARALFYWSMLHQNFGLFEFISISQIILEAPVKYARAFLHTETDDNDFTYFILHQAEVIQKAVEALRDYAARKSAKLRETERSLRGISGLNHRQQGLLAHALRISDAIYTIEGHRRSHGVVYQTARTDLLDLGSRGLLTLSKRGNALEFRVPPDLGGKLSNLGESNLMTEPDNNLTLKLDLPSRPRA